MANISMAPGVLIQEITGPGVIAGVGTSTAAFIGPAVAGPIEVPKFITSFEEFLETYAVPDGNKLDPHIKGVKRFYLAHAVEGFFLNGGSQAFVVRVGNGKAAEWAVQNRSTGPELNKTVFRVRARQEGTAGNDLDIEVKASTTTPREAVSVKSAVTKVEEVNGEFRVTVGDSSLFRVGDVVDKVGGVAESATIERIEGAILVLSGKITLTPLPSELKIANLTVPLRNTLRLTSTEGLFPGSVVKIEGEPVGSTTPHSEHAVIQRVDRAGFVTFASDPARQKDFKITGLKLISQEFDLIVTPPSPASPEKFENLSLHPLHPKLVLVAANSQFVQILPPEVPPKANTFPDALVKDAVFAAPPSPGIDDNPLTLSATEYKNAINALEAVDDVNLLVIPDASSHGDSKVIQGAMIDHCSRLQDRFAILDSLPNATQDQVLGQRKDVESEKGHAALYYPWLEVRDPDSPVPLPLFIPPSGHLAGVYARTDQDRGVHKAPANTNVRGVLGLQERVTDNQQIKLNDEGINVLRIFQGSNSVIVWGARTTVRKDITDWRYVPVRRLLLFIEESIEEGIRFAVFEPNGLPLWQQLKRTIREFLTRVWKDGALFGDTADKAFQVRIDEALNPPSVRALGQLFIEIKVAPVRPAEFIIVRIGLFDGGAEVTES